MSNINKFQSEVEETSSKIIVMSLANLEPIHMYHCNQRHKHVRDVYWHPCMYIAVWLIKFQSKVQNHKREQNVWDGLEHQQTVYTDKPYTYGGQHILIGLVVILAMSHVYDVGTFNLTIRDCIMTHTIDSNYHCKYGSCTRKMTYYCNIEEHCSLSWTTVSPQFV